MKLCIRITSKAEKSLTQRIAEIAKGGSHKYVRREGAPGNYKYFYRLPDGSIGVKEDLKTNQQVEQKTESVAIGDMITGADAYTGKPTSGKVHAVGKDGVTVLDEKGMQHHVSYKDIKQSQADSKDFIPPAQFKASEWKKSFTDEKVTPDQAGVDYILSQFGVEGKEIAQKARETQERVKELSETVSKYRISGEGKDAVYTPARERVHNEIIRGFLSPDKITYAAPPEGEKPVFILLGGRGGSGKSKFNGLVYDSNKFVVIDADIIKEKLPEYQGWNAGEVHEESSDISKKLMQICKNTGLNVVIDGTLSNGKKAVKQLQEFQNLGYRTEAHYMFLPVQESVKRAIGRFKTNNGDYSGRFVPLDMLVKMTDNESAFDEVKDYVDDWSFRSNYGVDKNAEPKLISKRQQNEYIA